jgi:hypothetical protein
MSVDRGFQSLTDLFGQNRLAERFKENGKKATSERAELIGYFARKMGWTDKGAAMAVSHLKENRDLYYLKSDCDQAEARGVPWPAAFRTALGITKKRNNPKS